QFVLRNSEHESVGRLFPAPVELNRTESAVLQTQAAHRRAENDLPAFFFDSSAAAFVEFGERNGWDAHTVTATIFEKGFPENVDAEAGIRSVEFFIECADEDDAPEEFDSARRLLVPLQPSEHGDGLAGVGVLRLAARKKNCCEGARDRNFILQGKRSERKKRAGHVQRCGQKAGLHDAGALLRIEKKQTVEELDLAGGAY